MFAKLPLPCPRPRGDQGVRKRPDVIATTTRSVTWLRICGATLLVLMGCVAIGCETVVVCRFRDSPGPMATSAARLSSGLSNANAALGSAVQDVLRAVGATQSISIRLGEEPLSIAVARFTNDQHSLTFDMSEFSDLRDDKSSVSYWTVRAIIAHEMGHVLQGHTVDQMLKAEEELFADRFAGFVLYRLGATLAMATVAVERHAAETATRSHPAKASRAKEFEDGCPRLSCGTRMTRTN